MMRGTEEVIDRLRGRGLKVTPQRLAVVDALKNNTTHPSAEDIFARVQKSCPTISFTTVYKTLEALTEMGYLNVLSCDESRARFDPNTTVHHHAVCDSCKSILDISKEAVESCEAVRSINGFKVRRAQIYLYGLCRSCQQSGKS